MDDLSIGIIIAQLINFGIIFWVFKKFLGEKLVDAIEERRKYLKSFENADAELKAKLDEADSQAKELLDGARTKASDIVGNAEGIAKKNIEKSKEKASMEAESILGNARSEIEKEKLSMVNEMKSKIVDLSLRLNEKMFKKESANKDFMEKELETLK